MFEHEPTLPVTVQLLHSPVHTSLQQTPSAQAFLQSSFIVHASPMHFGTGHLSIGLFILHVSHSPLGRQSTHIPTESQTPVAHVVPTGELFGTIIPSALQVYVVHPVGSGASVMSGSVPGTLPIQAGF